MDSTASALKHSLFVATGAFAGTMLLSTRIGERCSCNWAWQGAFGAIGGLTAAFMGSIVTKRVCN